MTADDHAAPRLPWPGETVAPLTPDASTAEYSRQMLRVAFDAERRGLPCKWFDALDAIDEAFVNLKGTLDACRASLEQVTAERDEARTDGLAAQLALGAVCLRIHSDAKTPDVAFTDFEAWANANSVRLESTQDALKDAIADARTMMDERDEAQKAMSVLDNLNASLGVERDDIKALLEGTRSEFAFVSDSLQLRSDDCRSLTAERDAALARCERLLKECEAWRLADDYHINDDPGLALSYLQDARRLRAEAEGGT
jgi:hypothetical protein